MYLLGSGFGALGAGTVSETFGRNVVYLTTFVVFMLCVLAKALAPNYSVAIAFRFLTGFFGSTPLTAAGGSMADVWDPLQLLYAIPPGIPLSRLALPYLRGCHLGPETYAPMLLEWRAKHLRALTGDDRYRVGERATTTTHTLGRRLLVNLYRHFLMVYTEPIILIFTFYLTIVYFVLFTFLNGYPFIFQQTYGISQSLTFILWTALLVGDLLALPLIPLIYGWAKKAAAGGTLTPEICLWYGMLGGSISLPVSLWWMAWTCYPSLNIWVPIVGSVFFGYGLVTIFTTIFLYTVSVRYIVAGALIPASVPMYERLGPHRALTIPAALATVMVPVPFVLYRYGAKIRGMSKIAPH
ncbi:MFS general substrate transporter [Apiospora arundinis]|uniref:MFS general substrate transporter n=1 Tax=Apiospora arundinis TaxID=335852 RepID=A0ABR2IJN7_9PEZI